MHLKKKKNVQLLKSKRQSKAITVTLLLLRENKRCMRNEVGTFFSSFTTLHIFMRSLPLLNMHY